MQRETVQFVAALRIVKRLLRASHGQGVVVIAATNRADILDQAPQTPSPLSSTVLCRGLEFEIDCRRNECTLSTRGLGDRFPDRTSACPKPEGCPKYGRFLLERGAAPWVTPF